MPSVATVIHADSDDDRDITRRISEWMATEDSNLLQHHRFSPLKAEVTITNLIEQCEEQDASLIVLLTKELLATVWKTPSKPYMLHHILHHGNKR